MALAGWNHLTPWLELLQMWCSRFFESLWTSNFPKKSTKLLTKSVDIDLWDNDCLHFKVRISNTLFSQKTMNVRFELRESRHFWSWSQRVPIFKKINKIGSKLVPNLKIEFKSFCDTVCHASKFSLQMKNYCDLVFLCLSKLLFYLYSVSFKRRFFKSLVLSQVFLCKLKLCVCYLRKWRKMGWWM